MMMMIIIIIITTMINHNMFIPQTERNQRTQPDHVCMHPRMPPRGARTPWEWAWRTERRERKERRAPRSHLPAGAFTSRRPWGATARGGNRRLARTKKRRGAPECPRTWWFLRSMSWFMHSCSFNASWSLWVARGCHPWANLWYEICGRNANHYYTIRCATPRFTTRLCATWSDLTCH